MISASFSVPSETNPAFKDCSMKDFTVDILDQVKALDIEEYQEYLKVYHNHNGDKMETNGERGLKRKISALRSFYAYYYKREMIETNPAVLVDVPKIHEKKASFVLTRMRSCFFWSILNMQGDTLTGQKRAYWEKNKGTRPGDRDPAFGNRNPCFRVRRT